MVRLADVRWIGGGSGAGKSTVAGVVGEQSGLRVVQTDLSLHPHAAAMAEDRRVAEFVRMTMDERWVDRTPEEMLETFPWFAGVGFDLLLDEVLALPDGGPVLVEGFRLLPRLVAPLLEGGARAVWLLPTPERRRAVMLDREAERAFWRRTSDPDRALANVLERDRLFTEQVEDEARALGLATVGVSGSEPVAVLADRVARLLDLSRTGGVLQQD